MSLSVVLAQCAEQSMNLSAGSFYHEGDELTPVNKQQFYCFSPLKAVQF